MAHTVVKIFKDSDGAQVEKPVWHYGNPHPLCDKEYFFYGISQAVYKTKSVNRGGITCKACIDIIKYYKSIKL